MRILVEGNEEEIEKAKSALESTCLFNIRFCDSGLSCIECEVKQELKIEYIIK